MVAEPTGPKSDEYDAIATQWFIVSDLGLSAYSGNDGIHVFVHGLATTEPKGLVEVRLISRSNEVLATRRTDGTGHAHFEAGLARGEGGMAPAMLVASEQPRGDYAFLSLKTPGFDLSDRGVSGRAVRAGLDAFVYTERGVYRSGETVHATALLRDGQGAGRRRHADDLRGRAAGRRRVSPRGGARSGRRRAQPERAARRLGFDRDLAPARLYRSEAPAGGRDHLHGGRLCAGPAGVRACLADRTRQQGRASERNGRWPLPLWRTRRQASSSKANW